VLRCGWGWAAACGHVARKVQKAFRHDTDGILQYRCSIGAI